MRPVCHVVIIKGFIAADGRDNSLTAISPLICLIPTLAAIMLSTKRGLRRVEPKLTHG
jgi:hypothetical protein